MASGFALLATGGVLWTMAYTRYQSAMRACTAPSACPDLAVRVSGIETVRAISLGSLISGGVVLGGALGLHELRSWLSGPVAIAFDPVRREFSVAKTF